MNIIRHLKERLFCRSLDKRKLGNSFDAQSAELLSPPKDADEFHNTRKYYTTRTSCKRAKSWSRHSPTSVGRHTYSMIGALVTEVGSALSHGAVVAREYALPLVAGIPLATRRIKTGDLLSVDGTTGEVAIIG